MTPKFKVTLTEKFDKFFMVIENRAGRKWVSKHGEYDLGNAGESAMIVEEIINGGVKLNMNNWTEVQ
jgi:pyrroloquinoline quinone (PQQ) biosynthesis protein C